MTVKQDPENPRTGVEGPPPPRLMLDCVLRSWVHGTSLRTFPALSLHRPKDPQAQNNSPHLLDSYVALTDT